MVLVLTCSWLTGWRAVSGFIHPLSGVTHGGKRQQLTCHLALPHQTKVFLLDIDHEQFQKLHDFPAHVLTVRDYACVWVELDDQAPYVGLVLRLQHPDVEQTFDQLYRLHPKVAAHLIAELVTYLHPPEPI